ncbi:MAG TPA: tRNA pseudouridine(38-40) synthase TruA [Helicobacteraceae bacterium]|nr:tRNA pseudouridine(38-40) synthase TruA [Helicobacteraceae bacterium]
MGIETHLHFSGRTDRGVHASFQVVHFDLPSFWTDVKKLHDVLAHHLPGSITIRRIHQVSDTFHARYDAKKRLYRYVISTQAPNPFENDFITFVDAIDTQKIKEAITLFEGKHNFEYFMKTGSDTTHFIRTIYKTRCYQHKNKTILSFEANGFLRSQIRLMVGMLLAISDGKATATTLLEQLHCKKRHKIKLAPHNGLYLAKVLY